MAVSRQRRWQIKMQAKGRCRQCGKKRDSPSVCVCRKCLRKATKMQRERCGSVAWKLGGQGRQPFA